MMKRLVRVFLAALLAAVTVFHPGEHVRGADDPLQMVFHREAARRFVFSNNLPLAELKPTEIVGLEMMHPVMGKPTAPCRYSLADGVLRIDGGPAAASESSLYVGGVHPFAVYDVAVRAYQAAASADPARPAGPTTPTDPAEVALEWAALDGKTRAQVVEKLGASADSLVLRVWKDGALARERVLFTGPAVAPPYKLRVQMAGGELAAFVEQNGVTTFLGRAQEKDAIDDVFDPRDRRLAARCTFNLATRLGPDARLTLDGAGSYLSAGVGQADIRNITHRDGTPFIENNRLWFTFSVRGLSISSSCQGVMSLDPSTFDARLEGIILFDRGDGLWRNDYASHVFYDDEAKEWRAFTCCFSRSAGERGPTGVAVARSVHDPRRGISIMREEGSAKLPTAVEDPCVVYDADARKWRLLGTALDSFRAVLFESDQWDGTYVPIGGPGEHDSTGTLIQRIGEKRYVFAGSKEHAIFVYSYPDLKTLGRLNMDLPPFDAHTNARVWPDIVPLPDGYPARYLALMMDRANVPGGRGQNWSYGALYLYSFDAVESTPVPARSDSR